MEKYRKGLQRRIAFGGAYCALIVVLSILAAVGGGLEERQIGFTLGFGFGIGAVMIVYMAKYRKALQSEELMKALYVEETDERRQFIDAKIGGAGLNISIMGLALAMLIANFFNETVFFTLLAVTLFLVAVKGALKVYYNKTV